MKLLKIILLGLFGAASAGIVDLINNQTNLLSDDPFNIFSPHPGTIFGVMILIGMILVYKNKIKLFKDILFLIISTLAYFASVMMAIWSFGVRLDQYIPAIAFFMAGLIGAFIMLLGLQLILETRFKLLQIVLLSLIGGIVGVGSISPIGSSSMEKTVIANTGGFVLLYYSWNTIMALGIGVVLNKNQNKWQSKSQATAPRAK